MTDLFSKHLRDDTRNEKKLDKSLGTENVHVSFNLTGPTARRLILEAQARGVNYSDMAKIILEQGIVSIIRSI